MADLIVSDGYLDVGYSYINVDDCWLAHTRDQQCRLQVILSQFLNDWQWSTYYISDWLFRQMADLIVSDGYWYVVILT